jgi:hypothetical protein
MRRSFARLGITVLLVAAAIVPATTAEAKQYPTSLTSNDVSVTYTDSNGTNYVTELGGLLQTNRRCRKNRLVTITFTDAEGATKSYGSDTTDGEGVFVIPHATLDAPSGTDFLVVVAERKVRHGKCLATQVTIPS